MLRPLLFFLPALSLLCLIIPALSAPAVDGPQNLLQPSSSSVSAVALVTPSSSTSLSPTSTATLPFLYGKLADKFLRINDAYLGFKTYVLPDDALASKPSYSSGNHRIHHLSHKHSTQVQGQVQGQRTHEHDTNDAYYGPPVPPSEYQPPRRPLFRPFVSWSNKAKAYSFKSCLSAVKKVGKHAAKEE